MRMGGETSVRTSANNQPQAPIASGRPRVASRSAYSSAATEAPPPAGKVSYCNTYSNLFVRRWHQHQPFEGAVSMAATVNVRADVQFNLALTQERVSAAVPEREYFVWRDRFTYRQLTDRSCRLACFLHSRGLGVHTERDRIAGCGSGQDHVALYMRNCNEFIESMLGAFKSRTVPVNVNYRYVADELRYLLRDSGARAVIYHAAFAPALAGVLDVLPPDVVLVQVTDDSGSRHRRGAVCGARRQGAAAGRRFGAVAGA